MSDTYNDFCSTMFSSAINLSDAFLYDQITFNLEGSCLVNCASTDPQSNYFLPEFPKP